MEEPTFEPHGTQCISLSLLKPMRYPMKIPTANTKIINQTIINAYKVIPKTTVTITYNLLCRDT